MKLIKYTIIFYFLSISIGFGQQQEINFVHQNIDFSAAPRTSLNPMSIKLWDNYNNGGPTAYGTVLEIYGLSNHQTGQFYFAGWDNSKIRYREAFYAQNSWSDWITLLDSKNNLESSGLLMISGQGSHYIKEGNLGIGTTTPREKLSVNGNIRAKEVKVETANWPDYVFKKGYKITSLSDLEGYIKTNGHLPEMPDAKDAEKNGIALGDMNKLLLKKVEELTLHLIEKEKTLNDVLKRLEKIENQTKK